MMMQADHALSVSNSNKNVWIFEDDLASMKFICEALQPHWARDPIYRN